MDLGPRGDGNFAEVMQFLIPSAFRDYIFGCVPVKIKGGAMA